MNLGENHKFCENNYIIFTLNTNLAPKRVYSDTTGACSCSTDSTGNVTIDLSKYTIQDGEYKGGSIIIPEGFSYTIKNVTTPEYGKLQKVNDFTYNYTPNKSHLKSGKIFVTLEITKDDNSFLATGNEDYFGT